MKQMLTPLVIAAGLIAVVGISHGVPAVPVDVAVQTPLGLFGWLDGLLDAIQNFIARLDEFLEAIVDLLETLGKLFGEGGEGGD